MILKTNRVKTNKQQLELYEHGESNFPIVCFEGNLKEMPISWHYHNEFELVYVYEGVMEAHVSDKIYTIGKGNGLFINSQVLHADFNYGDESCKFHSIVFHSHLIGDIQSIFYQKYLLSILKNENFNTLYLDSMNKEHNKILEMIEKAWHACFYENIGYEFEVRNALSSIIVELYQLISIDNKKQSNSRDLMRIKQMIEFMNANISEKISLKDIADSCSISESECLRCFKKCLGITPMKILFQIRMNYAMELLTNDDLTIQEVAMECGFSDVSYFIKSFREKFGKTPNEYKKSGRV